MTNQSLQALIKAGDEQKCHVFHNGLHYFKFGSYWIVEDEGPVTLRVFDTAIIRALEDSKEKIGIKPAEGAPQVTAWYECRGRAPYGCGWKGPDHEIEHLNDQMGICPNCGQWVHPIKEDE